MQILFGVDSKFDIKPPEVFQITGKLKALPEQIIALSFLEDSDTNLKKQQHAVSTLIKYDANYYLEIDSLIDYKFTKQAINKIANRKIDLINSYSSGLKNHFDAQKYAALQKQYEKKYGVKGKDAVLIFLLMDRIREDEFTYKALQKKYPGLSDEDIAKKVLKIE